MRDTSKGFSFWPAVDTEQNAKKVLQYGWGAALFSGVVTALVAAWAMGAKQKALGYVGPEAFVDVVFFLAIAFGIYKGSRAAAVVGLILFLSEKVYEFQQTGHLQGAGMGLVMIYCYIQAIRAAYSLHRLRQQPQLA